MIAAETTEWRGVFDLAYEFARLEQVKAKVYQVRLEIGDALVTAWDYERAELP